MKRWMRVSPPLAVFSLHPCTQTRRPCRADFVDTALVCVAEIRTRRGSDVDPSVFQLAGQFSSTSRSHRLPVPRDDSEDDGRLFIIPSGPRSDVARGLLQLARLPGLATPDVLDAVEVLAADEVPWIRYAIAISLPDLRRSEPERMWRLLRHLADTEMHDGVLRGVARSAWVLREEMADAVDVLDRVAARATVTGHRETALEACTEAAGLLWVLRGHSGARDILDRLLDLDRYGADAVTAMLHEIRVSGAFTSDDEGTRQRTIELCAQLVESAVTATGDLLHLEPDPSDARRQQIKTGLEVLDSVASQLYFASGAHDARRDNMLDDATPEQVRLADEAVELIARVDVYRCQGSRTTS